MADPKSTTPVPDWIQIDAVRRQVEMAADMLAVRTRENYVSHIAAITSIPFYVRLESPLEAIFYAWWEAAMWDVTEMSATRLRLQTQQEVAANGRLYRLDFVISLASYTDIKRFTEAGRPFPLIAVEVDGHEFHERTREQVAYRNQRDRDLQKEGWKVYHFSWSEVVENGAEAVGSVVDAAIDEWMACDKVATDKWYADHPEALEKLRESVAKAHAE